MAKGFVTRIYGLQRNYLLAINKVNTGGSSEKLTAVMGAWLATIEHNAENRSRDLAALCGQRRSA
jgi:hypothetical protein